MSLLNLGYDNVKGFYFFAAIIVEYLILVIFSIFTSKEWSFKELHLWALKKVISRIAEEYALILQHEYKKHDVTVEELNDYIAKIDKTVNENEEISLRLNTVYAAS